MPKLPVYIVILAGGSGTRFWPKSRRLHPKQFCKLGGSSSTMIEETIDRIETKVTPEKIILVTNKDLIGTSKEILGTRVGHFIAEPEAKNTAAALTLAALEIESLQQGKPAVMVSLHADHLIKDTELFCQTLDEAILAAEAGKLTLIGIEPDSPATGFGYIKKGASLQSTKAFEVASFEEKPNLDTAKKYIDSGQYLWNSGLFIWQTTVFLSELREYEPGIVTTLSELQSRCPQKLFSKASAKLMQEGFSEVKSIAIDNALLERSQNVAVVPGAFDWKDIGSWDALEQCFPLDENKNYKAGPNVLIDCEKVTVDSDGPLIAAIGLEDLVIVASGNSILVCKKDRAQDVKAVVQQLKDKNLKDFY